MAESEYLWLKIKMLDDIFIVGLCTVIIEQDIYAIGVAFMRWRWDQGRLEYFKFDNIIKIAKVLSELDGIWLNTESGLSLP